MHAYSLAQAHSNGLHLLASSAPRLYARQPRFARRESRCTRTAEGPGEGGPRNLDCPNRERATRLGESGFHRSSELLTLPLPHFTRLKLFIQCTRSFCQTLQACHGPYQSWINRQLLTQVHPPHLQYFQTLSFNRCRRSCVATSWTTDRRIGQSPIKSCAQQLAETGVDSSLELGKLVQLGRRVGSQVDQGLVW